ncbi:Shootin-1 [Collichthys lucidus]|uniref:Shootin-1 n=1 Tax=Collichthys lucidus TaxID=240159 RepID=A0A4U5VAV8_COLLU|nr:Shootin-1 [Collichthys lucidus]
MAADELQRVSVLTELSDRDKQIEGCNGPVLKLLCLCLLHKCKKLEEERDEVIKKLDEFQQGWYCKRYSCSIEHTDNKVYLANMYQGVKLQWHTLSSRFKVIKMSVAIAVTNVPVYCYRAHNVTQMVIEEVSAIQENLEIERTCRESAVALAFKLNRQNCSLKRKSMMLLSQLSLETITEINLDDEEEEEESEEMHAASTVCLSPQCKTTISELQCKLELTLKEKNQAVTDLEALREQLRETNEELLKEKHDNTVLIAETVKQKKLLGKYNRVEEFEALQDTLNLERDLRTEAENLARVMLVEQKQLKRQSQILKQTSSPSEALQEALSQISGLTQDLETQRLEHQNQVCVCTQPEPHTVLCKRFKQIKQMEDRLRSCETQRALTALRRKLELVEEERREYSDKCSKTEVEVKDLRFTGEDIFKTVKTGHTVLYRGKFTINTVKEALSLLALIQKRKVSSTDIPLVVQDSAKTPEVDIKQQAVEEMMQRIKKGVQLRPVRQFPNRTRRQENFSRTTPQPKAVSPSTNHDEELQRILLRRRDALEPQHNNSAAAFKDSTPPSTRLFIPHSTEPNVAQEVAL